MSAITTYYKWDKTHRLTTRWQDGGEAHYFTYNQRNMVTGIVDHNHPVSTDAPRSFVYNAVGERVVGKDNSSQNPAYWCYDGRKFLRDRELGGSDAKYRHNDEDGEDPFGSLNDIWEGFSRFAVASDQSGSQASAAAGVFYNPYTNWWGLRVTNGPVGRLSAFQPTGDVDARLTLPVWLDFSGGFTLKDSFVSSGGVSGPGVNPHPKESLDGLRETNNGQRRTTGWELQPGDLFDENTDPNVNPGLLLRQLDDLQPPPLPTFDPDPGIAAYWAEKIAKADADTKELIQGAARSPEGVAPGYKGPLVFVGNTSGLGLDAILEGGTPPTFRPWVEPSADNLIPFAAGLRCFLEEAVPVTFDFFVPIRPFCNSVDVGVRAFDARLQLMLKPPQSTRDMLTWGEEMYLVTNAERGATFSAGLFGIQLVSLFVPCTKYDIVATQREAFALRKFTFMGTDAQLAKAEAYWAKIVRQAQPTFVFKLKPRFEGPYPVMGATEAPTGTVRFYPGADVCTRVREAIRMEQFMKLKIWKVKGARFRRRLRTRLDRDADKFMQEEFGMVPVPFK